MASNSSNESQFKTGEIIKDEYQLTEHPLKKSESISEVLDSLDTQQSRIKSIKITNCKIKSLPEKAFVKFSTLTSLNLSNNRLQSLPQDFKNLTALRALDLSGNKFHAIPSALGSLVNLEKLSLRENLLSEIPSDLGAKFERLRELDLSENKLVGGLAIEAVCHLPNLVQLFLQHNKISFLPQKISKLKTLKVLKLNDNLLERLPSEIGELTALIELQLQENHLRLLPASIGKLKKLRSLYLEFNSLHELPNSVVNMSGLHLLFLHNNKLEQIPEVLKEPNFLKQLLRVSLDENPLPKDVAKEIKQRGTIAFLSDQGGVLGISRRVRGDRRLVAWGTASNLWDFVTDSQPDSESGNNTNITTPRPGDGARASSDPRMELEPQTSLLDELGNVDFPQTSRSDPSQVNTPRSPGRESPATVASTPRSNRAADPPRSTRLYDPKRRSVQVRGAEMVKHNSADTVLTLRGFSSKTLEEYFTNAQNEEANNNVISPRAAARRSVMVPQVTIPRPSSPTGSPVSPTKSAHHQTGSNGHAAQASPPPSLRGSDVRVPLEKLSNSNTLRPREYSLSAREKAVSSDGYFKEKIPHFSAFKERYRLLLEERDFSQDRKRELNKLSTEEKWKFMKRYRGSTMDILTRIDEKTPRRTEEQTFFKPVETLAAFFEGPINQKLRETMILLRKVLNSENWDWISDFIERGVNPLIGLIRRISQVEDHDSLHEKIHAEALECLDVLIDYATENVLKGVDADNVVFVLLSTLQTESTTLLIKTFNILIKVCEVCSAGSGIALDALNNFKLHHENPNRFTPVLDVINKTKSIKLHAACFAFINWIIDSEDDVRIRYEMRSELEEADIATLTDHLRATIEAEDEVKFENERIRSLSKKASTLNVSRPSSLVPADERSNSDDEDIVLAKDDLLTQIETFEEGFELDFEEMEDRFETVAVTRPRVNSSKENSRNPNNLVVICSTNLKLSLPYTAETTYAKVFEDIAREHEVPDAWSTYDLFLPESGDWMKKMGDLPFQDKQGEILCELKRRTKKVATSGKSQVKQEQHLAEIFQLLLSSPAKDTQSSPRRESLTMSKSPLKKSQKKNNRMSQKLENDFKAPIRVTVEGPPGVCCALLLPPSFSITEVKRSALASLGNPLSGSKTSKSAGDVIETDVNELSAEILQQVGNIEKYFHLEVQEEDKWITLDENTPLSKCNIPPEKSIRLSLAPMNVTLNVDVEKPVVVRLTKKKKIDCNKTVSELIKYYCKSIPFDLEPQLYCLCVVYKSKPKEKVILRDNEPLVNQLASIDMELMLVMKEDKSLLHEFKESRVPFWEDTSASRFNPEADTDATTINQLIYYLLCTIEIPFPEQFAVLFISTMHSFTTVPMLFKKLEEFTSMPKKIDHDKKQKYYGRMEEFLRLWSSTSVKDFTSYPAAFDKFLGTVDDKLGKHWDKLVSEAKQSYKAKKESAASVSDFKLLRRQTFRGPLSISDIDESQFAQHLTVQAFSIFACIQPSEWVEQGWTGPKYKKKSKNIVALIDHYNEVSQWVTSLILSQTRIRSRSSILNYFIRVAFQLKLLNNYHTLGAVIAGLNNSNILRLKYTFEKLPSRSKALLRDLEQLMTMMQNFKNYRRTIKEVKGPTIPYLAVHLKDLSTISENNPDVVEDDKINWAKRKLYYQVIEEMTLYKRTAYQLSTIKEVDSVLSRLPKYTEQELYAFSLKYEPQNASRANIL